MDYNFGSVCADHVEKLKKKLKSLNKSYIKEYELALVVINNKDTNDRYNEIISSIENLLNDSITKCEILYMETMNKIQRELEKHL